MARYIDFYENKYFWDTSIARPGPGAQTPFEFFVIMRLYLEAVNPPGHKRIDTVLDWNNNPVPTMRWDGASWLHFTTKYVKMVMEAWDKAFLLIPPATYDGFAVPEDGSRRNLLCRLDIQLMRSPKDAHASVRVFRLANPGNSIFRADSADYDSNLVEPSRRSFWPDHADFLYNKPAHELGHLLLLPHVNEADPRCDPTRENSVCYGSNLAQRMNVMGAGSMLDLDDAKPWIIRIAKHTPPTQQKDWKVDWASSEAALRGVWSLHIDEKYRPKAQPQPKPGIIDL
jgi:hypothetical protein